MLMAIPETETRELAELVELDQRRGDAMLVTLWWVKNTMETYVEVVDLKKQPPEVTTVPVPAGKNPNDVFAHPFGYEAANGKQG